MKISVVLPVYNVENYLSQCLDSLLNQTFDDFEIICVNDGSTDSSLDILENYDDKRIRIITQENMGLSGARNTGLKYVAGDYTLFVDSDDWLEKTALEKLYEKANEFKSDIIMFCFKYYYQDSDSYGEGPFTNLEMLDSSFENRNFTYSDVLDVLYKVSHAPFNKLYRTSFLKSIDAEFPQGLNYEDLHFFYTVFFKAEKVSFLRQYLYFYRIRDNSISTTGNRKSFDIFEILSYAQDNIIKNGVYEKTKDDFLMFIIVNLKYVYLRLDESLREDFFSEIKKNYNNYNLNDVKKSHLDTWHFDDRVFYESIADSKSGLEFHLTYRKSYYKFLANHYMQLSAELEKKLAEKESVKDKLKHIVGL